MPIENGMRGEIIAPRDQNPVAGFQDVMFIDRGRVDGIVPGDVFEVVVPDIGGSMSESYQRRVGVIEIVHVRDRSASGQIISISDLGIRPGAPVRLIRKMQS